MTVPDSPTQHDRRSRGTLTRPSSVAQVIGVLIATRDELGKSIEHALGGVGQVAPRCAVNSSSRSRSVAQRAAERRAHVPPTSKSGHALSERAGPGNTRVS